MVRFHLLALGVFTFSLQLQAESVYPPHAGDSGGSSLHSSRPSADTKPSFRSELGINADPAHLDWKSINITQEALTKAAGAGLAQSLKNEESAKALTEGLGFIYSELATSETCPSDDFLLKVVQGEVNTALLAVDKRVDENFNKCLARTFKNHLVTELNKALSGEVCLNASAMKELSSKTEKSLRQPFFRYMGAKQFGAAGLGVPEQLAALGGDPSSPASQISAQRIENDLDDALKIWISDALARKLSECSGIVSQRLNESEFVRALRESITNARAGKPETSLDLQPPSPNQPPQIPEFTIPPEAMSMSPKRFNGITGSPLAEKRRFSNVGALAGMSLTNSGAIKLAPTIRTPADEHAMHLEKKERQSNIQRERELLAERVTGSVVGTTPFHQDYVQGLAALLDKAAAGLAENNEEKYRTFWTEYEAALKRIQPQNLKKAGDRPNLLHTRPMGPGGI